MHTMNPLPALLFASLFAAGCATMSAEDCSGADWQTIGLTDGAQGQTLAKADRRANDCAKHGVVMDRNAYDAGRDQGLSQYCVEGNGYQLGERGESYNGVCVNHDEAGFLAAYEKGRELYAFTTAASNASSQLAAAEARHNELDAELDKYWSGYRDEDLTMEEVLVTATKRVADIQDIPIAVTAITGEQLVELDIVNVLDIEKTVPGMKVRYVGADPTIILRGAGTAGTNDIAVPMYIDGLYRPRAGHLTARPRGGRGGNRPGWLYPDGRLPEHER